MNYTSLQRKVAGGFLASAMLLTAIPAQAASISDLQAQLQALLAQVQALNTQIAAVGGTTSCTPFMQNLSNGVSGAEVTRLQNFLISNGYSIPAGATGYYGLQTQSAVAAFQAKHSIMPTAGYFGPLTQAKVNALCAALPQTPTPEAPSNGNNNPSTPTTGETLKGEGSIEKFDARSGDSTNLQEGQKSISVMNIEFDVEDGDVRINRVDLGFAPNAANNEKDPWDTFSEVALYDGNTRIARIDASNDDAWDEDQPSEDEYRLRFSGLSWVLKEGTEAKLTVKATTQKNIKGANDGEVWDIFVPSNGIRGLDADKASVFTGNSADRVSIDIDEAGSDDEIIVKRTDSDPGATTLQLKDNGRSGWTTVFAFDIDTDDSTNDIMVRKLPIQLEVGSSTMSTFVHDARIIVDGMTYTKKTVTDGATGTLLFEFNKNDFVIDAGDRVTVEVEVDFKQLPSVYEGTTITGSVLTANIVAEGADDLTGSQLAGAATGETHSMRTSGAILKAKSSTADFKANTANTMSDDQGTYSIKFEVTAFDRDIFIAKSTERGTVLGTAGVNYVIKESSTGGTETASGTISAILTSDAKTEGGYFKVNSGESKTFTLLVNYDPESTSFYNLQLHSLNWNTTAASPTTQQLAVPESNFETAAVSISN